MTAVANRNIKISKGNRVVKGTVVKLFRTILDTNALEVVLPNGVSFFTTKNIIETYFTEN